MVATLPKILWSLLPWLPELLSAAAAAAAAADRLCAGPECSRPARGFVAQGMVLLQRKEALGKVSVDSARGLTAVRHLSKHRQLIRQKDTSGKGLAVSTGFSAGLLNISQGYGDLAEDAIAITDLQAKAWTSTVIGELSSWSAGNFTATWFGGAGPLNDMQVHTHITLTMNFIESELTRGIRYVYPADSATQSRCPLGNIAYIWQGLLCNSLDNALDKPCGIDESGRRYVYICKSWYSSSNSNPNSRVGSLIRAVAWHAGLGDVSTDPYIMKSMSQAAQLSNAPNYQNFAQDVAHSAWGCLDSDVVNIPGYQLGSCSVFKHLCDNWQHGSLVREQCPSICGQCMGPVIPQVPTAGPISPTTLPPTSAPTLVPTLVPTLAPTLASTPTPNDAPTSSPQPAPIVSANIRPTRAPTLTSTPSLPPSPVPPLVPTLAPTPAPTPAPTAHPPSLMPPLPAIGKCHEPAEEQLLNFDGHDYSGSCSAYAWHGFCSTAGMKELCPVSCRACVPAGCEEDPTFDCEAWSGYVCWESVKQRCPLSCEVQGCTR
mmetsp:Transcript_40742/g.102335  ORF Transcript_40742/g.102335 Transcript_40742/m.102335 type:complete len:544 (-) Transcript_40742:217-1848(-)